MWFAIPSGPFHSSPGGAWGSEWLASSKEYANNCSGLRTECAGVNRDGSLFGNSLKEVSSIRILADFGAIQPRITGYLNKPSAR